MAPPSKSTRSRDSIRSTWSLGSKSNSGTLPTSRKGRLSSSVKPIGESGWVRFGIILWRSSRLSFNSRKLSSSLLSSSRSDLDDSIKGCRSSWESGCFIVLLISLRCCRMVSSWVFIARTSSSRRSSSGISRSRFRFLQFSAMVSLWERISFRSSIRMKSKVWSQLVILKMLLHSSCGSKQPGILKTASHQLDAHRQSGLGRFPRNRDRRTAG